MFHRGHYNILKRAKEHGDYLIVGVTGESYDIERGKLNVRDSLAKRIRNVEDTGFADEIIIEEYQGQKINDILQYGVDVFVIGSDWRGKFDHLSQYCEVVYLERTKDISSTQIRETSERIFNIGIATNDPSDNHLTKEALYVSGVHVRSAFSGNEQVLEEMRDAYELGSFHSDYDAFLDDVDIVYVKNGIENRLDLIERAICAGKHVIAEPPFTLSQAEARRIFELATEHGVLVTERVTVAFLRAFTQMIWFLHGGIIGDVVSVKIAMGGKEFESAELLQMQGYALYAAMKILNERDIVNRSSINVGCNGGFYNVITLSYPNKVATIELSSCVTLDNGLVVYGTKGTIRVPSDWWNFGYYEIEIDGNPYPKRYSFNFEGNGFRYILQDMLIAIKMGRSSIAKYSFDEMSLLAGVLNEMMSGESGE